MRNRTSTLMSRYVGFAYWGAVAGASSLAARTRHRRGQRTRHIVPLSESGSLYRLASSSVRSMIYETRTISFALDRIDQRSLPLDQTYRHPATNKGVTIYVFDGSVSMSFPEARRPRPPHWIYRVSRGSDAISVTRTFASAVAGAIAGSTLGVAPQAEIVDIKMLQCDKLRGTIKAIVDGAALESLKIINSIRGPRSRIWSFIADTSTLIPALDSAVSDLRAAGIAVVVSAGNLEIDACRVSPSNSPGTIVVGASGVAGLRMTGGGTSIIDRRAPGTAYGPCIDVYAPGDSVLLPSLDRKLGRRSHNCGTARRCRPATSAERSRCTWKVIPTPNPTKSQKTSR